MALDIGEGNHPSHAHPGISRGLSMRSAPHRVKHYGPENASPEVDDPSSPASVNAFRLVPPGIFLDTKTAEMLISTPTERRAS